MCSLPSYATKPIILCVDDSATHLWLRAKVLEQNGYAVLRATSASRALQLLRQNAISLVLSDHMLSETSGLELARQIKRINPHVPVVLYSGAPPPSMEGVDCFIIKGEPVTHFLAIIRDLLDRYGS
jgi:CheY-like chemotaxis protein